MSTEKPTTNKAVYFSTYCKNGCGHLSVPITFSEKGEDHSDDRWIRCTECETINRAFDSHD